jgi:hypothetical protein
MTATLATPYRRIHLEDDPYVSHIDIFDTVPGHDRPKPDYPYLSPSQITQYDRCAAAYFLKYHDSWKLREPQNSRLTFGSGWHGASHVFLTETHGSTEARAKRAVDAGKALMRELKTEIWEPTYDRSKDLDSIESLDRDLEHAVDLSIPYWLTLNPVAVERGWTIWFRGDRKVLPIHGFCDLIDAPAADWHALIDLKSGRAKKLDDIKYSVAQRFYAAAHSRVSPQPIHKSKFMVYKKTKERVLEIVDGPDFTGIPPVSRLYSIASAMTTALEHGVYTPTPKAQICPGCHFHNECDEVFGV